MVFGVIEKILVMCISKRYFFEGNKTKKMCDLHLSSFYWPLEKLFALPSYIS